MTTRITLCFSVIGLAHFGLAQPQHRNWFFGESVGLDMSTVIPSQLAGSTMYAMGGSASISDAGGQLLFYATGEKVWDRNHAVMPNGDGLAGHEAAAQGALIVPVPGDAQRYYLFTVPARLTLSAGGYAGLAWSMVDMGLNGGNGDVTLKNVPLMGSVTEKLTATRHANGRDVWVVAHGFGNADYYAYLVTCSGIGGPVVSPVGGMMDGAGAPNNSSVLCTQGWMVFSPQGDRLAATWSTYENGKEEARLDLCDFDRITGVVSNPVTDIHNSDTMATSLPEEGTNIRRPYGLCFSLSGERLYTNDLGGNGLDNFAANLYQYDLTDTDPMGTEVLLLSRPFYCFFAMQRGLDGKIYVARATLFLTRINSPDALGSACDPQETVVPLAPSWSIFGLPNFWDTYPPIVEYPPLTLSDTTACTTVSVTLDATWPQPYQSTSYLWNTGDTTASITVEQSGTYSVLVQLPCASAASVDTVVVTFVDCEGLVDPPEEAEVWLPNVFSPNSDGVNDGFTAMSNVPLKNYQLRIFNRWGDVIFSSTRFGERWNGRASNGAVASDGVYIWTLAYDLGTGAEQRTGQVTLLR